MNALYEILVPTEKPDCIPGKNRYFTKKYHQEWDKKVIAISNGLTVLQPTKSGSWVAPNGKLFREKMIPVRVACTKDEIVKIMDVAAKHYKQKAIMAYKLSEEVLIRNYEN